MLLALVREGDGLARRVLAGLQVELGALRAQVGVAVSERSQAASAPQPKARCAAITLFGLMLGDPTPLLAAMFEQRGVDPSLLGRLQHTADSDERASLAELLLLANVIANERGDDDVTSDHLLLAILSHDNYAAKMLKGVGIDKAFVVNAMGAGDGT